MFNHSINRAVIDLIDSYGKNNVQLDLINLATSDGFSIHSYASEFSHFDSGKMAAAASTLYSVGDAVAHQILSKEFKMTFIETEGGNVAFIALRLQGKDFVLTMSGNKTINMGTLRLLINRLAGEIRKLNIYNTTKAVV